MTRGWFPIPSYTTTPFIYVLVSLVVVVVSILITMPAGKFDPKGKVCYVTGGTLGLGKALAEELVRRGAHVVVVARNKARVDATAENLKGMAKEGQKILGVSADLSSREASEAALAQASKELGMASPDYVFLCAGFGKPTLFVEAPSEDLTKFDYKAMDGIYWVSAWTAHAVIKSMVKNSIKGKVVFVSSFLGYTSFAGWATYSPGKYALRGLADALRSEMLLHEIDVHLYMPAGMLTPGLEEEQKTKPAVTLKIEEDDPKITAEAAANLLLRGIKKGNYQITNDLITDLVRTQSCGAVPGNGPLDAVYWFIAGIGLPIWRMMTDSTVRSFRTKTREDLTAKGLIL